jgi:hypothetical protein
MPGIKDINRLLKNMKPKLVKGQYVFCTKKGASYKNASPIMIFQEKEGTTAILKKNIADKEHIPYSGTWAWITLTVHSDLAAVGFLAAITRKLAAAGISVNAVSAYYHDHLFVPADKAERAMRILKEMTKKCQSKYAL